MDRFSNSLINNRKQKRAFSTSPAIFFPGIFGIGWIFQLIKEWSGVLYRSLGTVIAIGIFFVFILAIVLIDDLLARAGIQRPIRSGIWASAVLGPVLGFAAFSQWGHPIWSQIIAFASAILTFGVIYLLDRARHGADIAADSNSMMEGPNKH
jgi:hypothetical protein